MKVACLAWCCVACFAQSFTVPVAPYQTTRTDHFKMNAGDEFTISARPGEPIAINTYIYDSRDALVFMDDEDGPPVPSFRWRASVSGDYYVVVRNTTNNRGTVVVSIGRSMGPPPSPQDYDGASIRLFFATNTASFEVPAVRATSSVLIPRPIRS